MDQAPRAAANALTLAASGAVGLGKAVRVSGTNQVSVATTNLRTTSFLGASITSAASGEPVDIAVVGPIDPVVFSLGTGVACAVGADVDGNLVRATDSACTSAPNWIGSCDASGRVIVNPRLAQTFDVLDFGAIPDWNGTNGTDNLSAFYAALTAMSYVVWPNTKRSNRLRIDGQFYLSDTLHLKQTTVLEGTGTNSENHGAGSMLVFPPNKTGIRVHSGWDDPIYPNPGYWDAGYSRIQDLTVTCSDPNSATQGRGHGVHSSTVFYMDGVTVTRFGGSGVLIAAGAGSVTPGNADTSRLFRCVVGTNKGHGIHIHSSSDANIISVVDCESVVNQGWGIFDAGINNCFFNVHCEGNQGHFVGSLVVDASQHQGVMYTPVVGSITIDTPVLSVPDAGVFCLGQSITMAGVTGKKRVVAIDTTANQVTLDSNADATVTDALVQGGYGVAGDVRNHDFKTDTRLLGASTGTFIGCYSEVGTNDVLKPCVVIGGLLSQGPMFRQDSCLVLNGNVLANSGLEYTNSYGPVTYTAGFGEGSTNMRAFSMQAEGDYWSWDYDAVAHSWKLMLDSALEGMRVYGPAGTDNVEKREAPGFTSGLYVGDPDAGVTGWRYHRYATASPTSGTYRQGDIVWNSTATAGGDAGWICVVGGAPGTWKTFGTIAA